MINFFKFIPHSFSTQLYKYNLIIVQLRLYENSMINFLNAILVLKLERDKLDIEF